MTTKSQPRVALVGCGQWGRNLAQCFAQEMALEALVDNVSSTVDQLVAQLSNQGYNTVHGRSWEDILKDASIDAVALATPATQHAEMAVAALTSGKHVFVEKPLALSVQDGERVVRAATTAGKLVMVGHLFQYHPAFVKLKSLVHDGKLGRIKHVHSRRLGFGRIREQEDAFWNLGPHDISMVLALASEMPVEVMAKGCYHLRLQTADVATAELTFASGLQAQIFVSWLYPQKERKLIVVGDRATAVFDDCEPWENKLRIFDNKVGWSAGIPHAIKGNVETVVLKVQEPLILECQHFLNCVKSGQQPLTGNDEAMRVVEVLCWVEDMIRKNNTSNYPMARDCLNRSVDGGFHMNSHWATQNTSNQDESPVLASISSHCKHETITAIDHPGIVVPQPGGSIPLVDIASQRARIQNVLMHRITKVLNHGTFILGPEVRELEARLAEYSGAAHVVTCGSGTDALILSLLALDLQPGDAVLVPDLSFIATVEPIVLLGAVPVFVDVEPETLTIDPSLIDAGIAAAKKAGYRAVGIIAADLYGHPADYDSLHDSGARHGLWVIGDAAQSFGGSSGGRRVGSLARVTTTSFFPSKPLGCYGDGGAVFTDDNKMAELLRSLRQHGLDKSKSNGLRIGLNSRLDTIQAAVLLCKLDLLEEEIIQRATVAETYSRLVDGIAVLPTVHENVRPAWAAYTIRTQQRDIVMKHLNDTGIPSAIYYAMPFHKQTAYQRFPVIDGSCPVAERACDEVLSLPIGPYMDFAAQLRITDALKEALMRPQQVQ